MIEFGNPLALLLLAPLLAWTLWRGLRLVALGPGRRRAVTALRCLLFTLLVFALAEIRLADTSDDLSVFYAIDWSDSIPEDQRQLALQFIQESVAQRGPDDRAGLMIFGRNPSIEIAPQLVPEMPLTTGDVQSLVSSGRTSIVSALRLALAALPETSARRVVLLSDGNQNHGDALEAAQLAQSAGVPIDVYPLRQLSDTDIRISRVDVPNRVFIDQPFNARIFVDADVGGEATMRIYEDNRLVHTGQVQVRSDIRNVYFVPRSLTDQGFHTYRAEIEMAGDSNPNNNVAEAFTSARGEPRVLLVDSEPELATDLLRALRQEEIDVDAITPDYIPGNLAELQSYDSVIFSNVGADRLGQSQMEMMERAVQDLGIGFIMIGGEHSFGPGGWQDTPVERLLPVSMDVSHRRVLPNGALCIVLHTCEIADGNAWAQRISLAALDVLSSRDQFGLLYFGPKIGQDSSQYSGYGYHWLGTDGMQVVGDKAPWRRLIQQVNPGDMPDFDSTLQMGYDSLSAANAALKHIVIISDGDPQPPNPTLAQNIFSAGISISTIVIRPHHPQNAQVMQDIARRYGGRFYYPTSPSQLPQIFIREAMVIRRTMINENTFLPEVVARSEAMPGFNLGTLPPLDGRVVVETDAGATVPIVTRDEETVDPILAHWRYGLGNSAAFMSDAKARWASNWLSWGEYQRFWAQLVRWSLRNMADRNFRVTTQMEGSEGVITIDAIGDDAEFINFAQFEGRLIPPSFDPEGVSNITFRQTAPGRYEGRFEVDEIGSHMISIAAQTDTGETQLLSTGLSLSHSPEFQTSNSNMRLLRQLAETTGGRVNLPPGAVFQHNLTPSRAITPMWPFVLMLALILLPFDIFVRRVMIGWSEIGASLALAADHTFGVFRRARPAEGPDEVTSTLLGVKERVHEERESISSAEEKRRLQEALSKVKAERHIVQEVGESRPRPRVTPKSHGGGEGKPPAPKHEEGGSDMTSALLRAKNRARKKM